MKHRQWRIQLSTDVFQSKTECLLNTKAKLSMPCGVVGDTYKEGTIWQRVQLPLCYNPLHLPNIPVHPHTQNSLRILYISYIYIHKIHKDSNLYYFFVSFKSLVHSTCVLILHAQIIVYFKLATGEHEAANFCKEKIKESASDSEPWSTMKILLSEYGITLLKFQTTYC